MSGTFEKRLAQQYDGLSEKLRRAGDFIAANPVDSASRPIRAIAQEAGVAPASFSRLARALHYDSFDALRDTLRNTLGRQGRSFAERAGDISQDSAFAARHMAACRDNLAALERALDAAALERAAEALAHAPRVFVSGALGARGVAEYLTYLAHFCAEDWRLMGSRGSSLGGALSDIRPGDAVVHITKAPFARRGLAALREARAAGAIILVITDSHACPALREAQHSFILPTQSPHFYSSYVATLTLIEILIGLIVRKSGPEARARIARVEQSNRHLDEVRDG